uniref:Uncharacterized protein n=2 Tax=Clytia hemisphaerica TaxID=252671 RepID=A0A7M5XD02_9CNID
METLSISPNPYGTYPYQWPTNKGRITFILKRLTPEFFKEDRTILKIENSDFQNILEIQMVAGSHRVRVSQGHLAIHQTPHLKKFKLHQINISLIAIGEGSLKMLFYFDGDYQGEINNIQTSVQDVGILMGGQLAAENIIFQDLQIYASEKIQVGLEEEIIGEIPFQWPPRDGYLSFKFMQFNQDWTNQTSRSLLTIKHPTNIHIPEQLIARLTPSSDKTAILSILEFLKTLKEGTEVLPTNSPIPKDDDFHRVNITYQSNLDGKITIEVLLNGHSPTTFTKSDMYRYYGLNIFTGDATGFTIKDLQYHSQRIINPSEKQLLGYLPFKWPPKHGFIRFNVKRIKNHVMYLGNQSEILTIGGYSGGERNRFVKYLVFALNQWTHQLDLIMWNENGKKMILNTMANADSSNSGQGHAKGHASFVDGSIGHGSGGHEIERNRRDITRTLMDDEDFIGDSKATGQGSWSQDKGISEGLLDDYMDSEIQDAVEGDYEEMGSNHDDIEDTDEHRKAVTKSDFGFENQDQSSNAVNIFYDKQEVNNNLDEESDTSETQSTNNNFSHQHDHQQRRQRRMATGLQGSDGSETSTEKSTELHGSETSSISSTMPSDTNNDDECQPSIKRCIETKYFKSVEIRFNNIAVNGSTKYEVYFNNQEIFKGSLRRFGERQNDTQIYSAFESPATITVIEDLIYSGE